LPFRDRELEERLSDAVRLVEASLVAKREGETDWTDGLRRAGELLEWLAHPQLNPSGLPLSLLGAAAYQLAGYPARASSLAAPGRIGEEDAPLLRLLLAGNFNALLLLSAQTGGDHPRSVEDRMEAGAERSAAVAGFVNDLIAGELASAIGVVCAALRWGDERRVEAAVEKLNAVSPALAHFADPYSWLVVHLTTQFAERALASSLRGSVRPIVQRLEASGQASMERYVRLAFRSQQILTWPSQQRGIDKLTEGRSFALCTPTGSGKTRVAEVALLEGLFQPRNVSLDGAPLCLYIVPTRALAAEVEGKLGSVLRDAGGRRAVNVTGLYGGMDWGPSDEWLASDDPTVLICTQEKAEALVRFFGGILLSRLQLVIVDEAHEVQFAGTTADLIRAESRALRLETLVTRLRARRPDAAFIAISAVARQLERPLARWISGGDETEAVTVPYRSTRQVVGRLHCRAQGRTRIEYDLLDGEPIDLAGSAEDEGPFVPNPFPPMPAAPRLTGPQQVLAPYALWASMHLSAPSEARERAQTVLVSISENIGNVAGWWLELLDETWAEESLPQFFAEPTDGDRFILWERALDTCRDLFGQDSREYRLLLRGIAVHHGRMPGRLPRLMTQLVEQQVVRVVLATSTLSQGVNLPVETVLVPSLTRFAEGRQRRMTGREFGNLIGRAGRPGVATEGQALVLLADTDTPARRGTARRRYDAVISELAGASESSTAAESALAELVTQVVRLSATADEASLFAWLETTAPIHLGPDGADSDGIRALDALDSVLLAAAEDSSAVEVEDQLRQFWAESFARYASAEERWLGEVVVRRGTALQTTIYPDENERRRYYRTSLPPRDAQSLVDLAPSLLEHLRTGETYEGWGAEERFSYIRTTIQMVTGLGRFAIPESVGGQATWADALRWWFQLPDLEREPTVTQVGRWHQYLQRQLRYKFTWGLGAVLGVALEDGDTATLMDWTQAGLPWAAIWIKDLLTWGTLDPVAAYMLARGGIYTRDAAAEEADQYRGDLPEGQDPLDPTTIRNWARGRGAVATPAPRPPAQLFDVDLADGVAPDPDAPPWRVVPVSRGGVVRWLDAAGFEAARSADTGGLARDAGLSYDFTLNLSEGTVSSEPYL
jgi:hypothetical protein